VIEIGAVLLLHFDPFLRFWTSEVNIASKIKIKDQDRLYRSVYLFSIAIILRFPGFMWTHLISISFQDVLLRPETIAMTKPSSCKKSPINSTCRHRLRLKMVDTTCNWRIDRRPRWSVLAATHPWDSCWEENTHFSLTQEISMPCGTMSQVGEADFSGFSPGKGAHGAAQMI
jgi:hypothetical protein